MLIEEIIFEDVSKLVTTGNERAWAFFEIWHERVQFVLIKRGKIDTTRYEHRVGDLRDSFQWSLNTIEDSL